MTSTYVHTYLPTYLPNKIDSDRDISDHSDSIDICGTSDTSGSSDNRTVVTVVASSQTTFVRAFCFWFFFAIFRFVFCLKKLWQNSITKFWAKLKKTQVVIKHKNSNCDKTKKKS